MRITKQRSFSSTLLTLLATLLMSIAVLPLTGCESDGPFEEAGEELDGAVDEVEDALDG